ncbi:hypothetical protein AU468_14300 [Alkalispirochaeta sphaeroplastigenens]|uniref:Zinc-ribbon domain-containing protein n=1 Tax=Alkalispirochaeta sphaeroplastigenens TaxID=1187066 RepID=A0A2S4JFA5_9SPIO|nr:zinc ribbon domain-containing protein [Alkalispirochaeta sphaeroplastigenens]POQ98203.1 hypothetical protein AU468_14300 [Alkalispirochaeta sphaeroplastigenens]
MSPGAKRLPASSSRKFFCGNCGREVAEDDTFCRHCAALFRAIKCPQCGYRGKQHHFAQGCPLCGFLGPSGEERDRRSLEKKEQRPKGSLLARATLVRSRRASSWQHRGGGAKSPPAWVFWFFLTALVGGFLILSLVYLYM